MHSTKLDKDLCSRKFKESLKQSILVWLSSSILFTKKIKNNIMEMENFYPSIFCTVCPHWCWRWVEPPQLMLSMRLFGGWAEKLYSGEFLMKSIYFTWRFQFLTLFFVQNVQLVVRTGKMCICMCEDCC